MNLFNSLNQDADNNDEPEQNTLFPDPKLVLLSAVICDGVEGVLSRCQEHYSRRMKQPKFRKILFWLTPH